MLKTKTVAKLRQVLFEESNNMDPKISNPYGVQSKEFKLNHDDLMCDLYSKLKMVRTIRKSDISGPIRNVIPEEEFFSNNTYFNNCVIVSSAGSLYRSNLGQFIGK